MIFAYVFLFYDLLIGVGILVVTQKRPYTTHDQINENITIYTSCLTMILINLFLNIALLVSMNMEVIITQNMYKILHSSMIFYTFYLLFLVANVIYTINLKDIMLCN